MQLAIQLRDSLGLSQQQLVNFAGGDRSQLTRAEGGQRSLTADAVINILKMHKVNAALLPTEDVQQLPIDLVASWQLQAEKCRLKLPVLEGKLAAMKASYTKARRLQQFTQQLKTTTAGELTGRQVRWIDEQEYQAGKTMEFYGITRQKLLAIEIAMLQAETAIYENAVATEVPGGDETMPA
ncbi:MAG: hypothetical protein V4717_20365 [Bacteroidota bacterium]